MAEMCSQCAVEEVTKFRGYAKYGLCYQCGLARSKENKATGKNREWVEKTKLKLLRAKQRKKEEHDAKVAAMQPGAFDNVKLGNAQKTIKTKMAVDDFKYIPAHIRWCALNPGVTIPDDEMSDRDRAKEQVYEQRVGPPSRLAENLYKITKGDFDAVRAMFKDIAGMHRDYQKKRESQDKLDDVKQIDDMWKMIDEAIKPDGIVGKARLEGKLPARRENKK